MKKLTNKIISSLLLIFVLAACVPAGQNPLNMSEYVDGLGRIVVIKGIPAKIISLAPSNTEILYAIQANAQMVGRDEFSDYPPEAASLTNIGGSMGKYNLEKIVELKPDLVLAAEINTPEQIKSLEDLNITVYYLSNPTDFDGLYANLNTVGSLTGHAKESATLVEGLNKE